MSDSRKEFEAAFLKARGLSADEYVFQRADSNPDRYWNEIIHRTWEGWQLALSVAPAPVAAEPVAYCVTINGVRPYCAFGESKEAAEQVARAVIGGKVMPLYTSPPVQEGPKGVEELPRGLVEDWEAEAEREGVMDTEYVAQKAVEWARQRSPAQSIPAAIPEELFDGFAVLKEIDECRHVSVDHVALVLDAVVKLIRKRAGN